VFLLLLAAALCPSNRLLAAEQKFAEQDFVLTAAQTQQLTAEALDGSGDSALRLSRFYSNVTTNLDEALKWAVVGAENGNANCAFTAYSLLQARESADDRRRAKFWLKRAADQGYRPAIDLMGKASIQPTK
jgi:TPR repeat protein